MAAEVGFLDTAGMGLRDKFNLVLRELVKAAGAVYGDRLVTVLVFGSVGRGKPRPDSDIDVLIVADDLPEGRLARMREFDKVEELLRDLLDNLGLHGVRTSLSPVFKTRNEVERGSPLFLDMVDDGVILYDRDGFMRSYLTRLARRLSSLDARRVVRGNSWHWVLNPHNREGEVFDT